MKLSFYHFTATLSKRMQTMTWKMDFIEAKYTYIFPINDKKASNLFTFDEFNVCNFQIIAKSACLLA